jgi:hypothetical protein
MVSPSWTLWTVVSNAKEDRGSIRIRERQTIKLFEREPYGVKLIITSRKNKGVYSCPITTKLSYGNWPRKSRETHNFCVKEFPKQEFWEHTESY